MKRLIIILSLICGVAKGQIVGPYITPSNFPKYIGNDINFNRNYLKDWDAQISKIQQATASSTASIVWIGDSWTMSTNLVPPISSYLRNKFGDGGVGYYGANTLNTGNSYGSGVQYATRTKVGSWTGKSQTTYINSAAIAIDSSSTLNDSIYYVGKITNAVVHYMKKSSGGSFVTRVDGTSPTTVSTSGSGIGFSSITGLTDGTHTISIKISTAGAGVLIAGCELNRNQNGIRVHNLGCSGSSASDWVLQNSTEWSLAIQQLAPNMAVIQLGVNDCAGNIVPATYIANITTIVNRVIAAMPRCAIVLFSPSDIGAVTTYPMSSYISVLKTYALANNYAFIDNYSLIGSYTTANTRGLYTNTTHINATGGEVLKQNFLNYLMNGQSMYYSNGLNTSCGEATFLNALSSGTANVACGYGIMTGLTVGTNNTGTGYNALGGATTCSLNTANGYLALNANSSGGNNAAFGSNALKSNVSNSFNSAFGSSSADQLNGGSSNSYFGYVSGHTNVSGTGNCGFGHFSLYTSGNVNYNTAIGYFSGYGNTTGANGLFLGAYSGYYSALARRVFINSIDRTTAAKDTTDSPIYIYQHTTVTSQKVVLNGAVNINGRLNNTQGTDVASAVGAIALGYDGAAFELTGTSAVTLISNLGYQNGSEITLIFTSTASLTDGTANSGTNIGFELAGNANFTGSADDVITLVLCEMGGTQRWREKSRSVN